MWVLAPMKAGCVSLEFLLVESMFSHASFVLVVFRIEEYLPSSIKPGFEQLRNALLNILVQTGIIHKSAVPADASEHPDVSRARTAFQAMEAEVSELRNKLRVQDDILGKDWGREWEWKKLENECVEKDMGE